MSHAGGVVVLRQRAELPADSRTVMDIIKMAYRLNNRDEANKKLRKLGLFLKTHQPDGKPELKGTPNGNVIYEFDTLSRLYPIMPENIPQPFMLLSINGKQGYLLAWEGESLSWHMLMRHEVLTSSGSIATQLYGALRKMHGEGVTHNDFHTRNILLREMDNNAFIIDPAYDGHYDLEMRIAFDLMSLKGIARTLGCLDVLPKEWFLEAEKKLL
jgi:hypothetical protein